MNHSFSTPNSQVTRLLISGQSSITSSSKKLRFSSRFKVKMVLNRGHVHNTKDFRLDRENPYELAPSRCIPNSSYNKSSLTSPSLCLPAHCHQRFWQTFQINSMLAVMSRIPFKIYWRVTLLKQGYII